MQIARKTRETNIAEHVLYMFQIEDLIRANNFDIDSITYSILEPQIQDENIRAEYIQWYTDLIAQMKRDRVTTSGHITDIQEILMELLLLHNTLLNVVRNPKYTAVFERALPVIKDFQRKSNSSDINVIEVGFNALYGKLMLRLQQKEISESSEKGFALIADLLGNLAVYYRKMKSGDLNFTNN